MVRPVATPPALVVRSEGIEERLDLSILAAHPRGRLRHSAVGHASSLLAVAREAGRHPI
jgi:hypothetical protein